MWFPRYFFCFLGVLTQLAQETLSEEIFRMQSLNVIMSMVMRMIMRTVMLRHVPIHGRVHRLALCHLSI